MKLKIMACILLSVVLSAATAWAGLTKTEISQLYVSVFNRASEGEGNAFWRSLPDMAAAAAAMLDTQAAKDYFGANLNTNQAFIEHIYLNTLNKTIADDAAGISYWVGILDTGTSRGNVVATLVGVIKDYAPGGSSYNPDDAATVAAYNQFTNRVAVSDYMADTVHNTPEDWATSTAFSSGLIVTDNLATVDTAKAVVDAFNGEPPLPVTCGAYISPGVWKEFDCYNLAAIGKTTNDDPFKPSWRLIGGYWQWGRKGPDPSQWYDTNTSNFAHGPQGPGLDEANNGSISGWDTTDAPNGSWSDTVKTVNDPCPAGYRVPTQSQWDGVIENNLPRTVGSWSDTWDDPNNYSSARFFGDDLMLPTAGGTHYISGSLGARGLYGSYWSSTETADSYARRLVFSSNNVYTDDYGRRYGMSVRCIAEDSNPGYDAGIVEMAIGSENNVISSFPGKSIESGIQIVSDGSDNHFSFEIMEGPCGMAVDSDGVVSYTIPETIETEISIPFKVKIMNAASNESVMLEGSIYVMTAVEIGSGIVTSDGGSVSDQSGNIVVEVPAGAVSKDVEIKIIQSRDESGNNVIDLSIDGDIEGTFELYLPALDSLESEGSLESLDYRETRSLKSSTQYPLTYSWVDNSRRYFTNSGYRLPNNMEPNFPWYRVVISTAVHERIFPIRKEGEDAYRLDSTQPMPTSGATLTGEPVLFIHGYWPSGLGFGGGEGTWGNFPLLIGNLNNGAYIPFEFRWRTNARFQDVADDLGKCLSLITSKTNKKVHIVAHSFGGVLTRTLLQKINGTDYTRHVASVTTLGTPHSGIFGNQDQETAHGVKFPKGQDSVWHHLVGQISTHQMGEPNFIGTPLLPFLGVAIEKGEVAADLANKEDYQIPADIPIQVGIGLKTETGDNLITYEGQRFHPDLTIPDKKSLLKDSTIYGGKVTEFIMNGYSHTDGTVSAPSEAKVLCSDSATCDHASYIAVKNWLETYRQGGGDTSPCGAYVAPGVWKEFDCYNLAAIGKTTGDDPFTPSWRLIGGYWQWGRKGPDPSQWYDTNTPNFAHGPTGPGESEANSGEISGWDSSYAPDGAWSDSYKTANDPCPSGYRVPTRSQWDGITENNTQSIVGSWSSDRYDDTNYSAARFYGNDLMLPAAGYRSDGSGRGALRERGHGGFYVSSFSDLPIASFLFFNSSGPGGGSGDRKDGRSVRCIAE